ncbi:mediator of RNA polymerase II transcription subunit 1 [Eurytemora carolleeae]|uniref:mediator of RNA polymerase II transcription subunit 1 n=1 Tax=Eurytemora carolleeae TaxID=1294199 RepID=UPI000C77C2D1|nr:mediator of RNA polymerase II transcription subunit 1 [Eurytemora carolleeae]|eukprot:XP_023344169.1 mediator of RNA polymerase II transcription subunit 1-like [Eurytemora affinis]
MSSVCGEVGFQRPPPPVRKRRSILPRTKLVKNLDQAHIEPRTAPGPSYTGYPGPREDGRFHRDKGNSESQKNDNRTRGDTEGRDGRSTPGEPGYRTSPGVPGYRTSPGVPGYRTSAGNRYKEKNLSPHVPFSDKVLKSPSLKKKRQAPSPPSSSVEPGYHSSHSSVEPGYHSTHPSQISCGNPNFLYHSKEEHNSSYTHDVNSKYRHETNSSYSSVQNINSSSGQNLNSRSRQNIVYSSENDINLSINSIINSSCSYDKNTSSRTKIKSSSRKGIYSSSRDCLNPSSRQYMIYTSKPVSDSSLGNVPGLSQSGEHLSPNSPRSTPISSNPQTRSIHPSPHIRTSHSSPTGFESLPETDIRPVSGLPKPLDRISRSNKPFHPSLSTSKTTPNIGSSRIKENSAFLGLNSENPEEKERHAELVNELRDVLEQKKVLKSVEMFSTVETNSSIFKFSTYKSYNPVPQKSENMRSKIKLFDTEPATRKEQSGEEKKTARKEENAHQNKEKVLENGFSSGVFKHTGARSKNT